MVSQPSAEERLAAIEVTQTHTLEILRNFREEFRAYVKVQNGRVDALERFRDERRLLERFGVGAFGILGGGGLLWAAKLLGVF